MRLTLWKKIKDRLSTPAVAEFFRDFKWYDYLVVALLAVFCLLFFFPTTDLWNTGQSSFAYLNGHILDFYEVNKKIFGGSDYYPCLYLLFAVWNIPLHLMGVTQITYDSHLLMTYEKLLPAVFLFATAVPVYRITRALGRSIRTSAYAVFLFLTSSTMFIATLCWGMYDTLLVFFITWGVYFFLRERSKLDMWLAMILMGLAFAMKAYSALVLFPLLLYRYKNLLRIAGYSLVSVLPVAVSRLVYAGSSAFAGEASDASNFTHRLFSPFFGNGNFKVSFFCLFYALLCLVAYGTEYDTGEGGRIKSLYLILPACATFYCFVAWNPQWFTLIVPFLAVTTALSAKKFTYLAYDAALGVLYCLHVMSHWKQFGFDLIENSYFARFYHFQPGLLEKANVAIGRLPIIYTSAVVALVLVHCLFKNPFKFPGQYEGEPVIGQRDRLYVYLRFLTGVGFYVFGMYILVM